ncbi:hypothetical protein [Adhaeribacter aerolatus]|nr:hypothetical protein [Adhaeribacter aerolatus]
MRIALPATANTSKSKRLKNIIKKYLIGFTELVKPKGLKPTEKEVAAGE